MTLILDREPTSLDRGPRPTAPAEAGDPVIWTDLRRFLLTGGVDRVPAADVPITPRLADPVRAALAADPLRTVAEILASTASPASRVEPRLLALALAAACDDALARRAALHALPRVAPASPELFLFATFVQGLRGWGRGLRRAVGAWYNDRPIGDLVDDVLATPAWAGWRHADLLRLGHPRASTTAHDALYRWLTTGIVPAAGAGADVPGGSAALDRVRAASATMPADDRPVTVGVGG